jgi:hypothetical protein
LAKHEHDGEIWIPWTDVKKLYRVTEVELKVAVFEGRVRSVVLANPVDYNLPDFTAYAIMDLEKQFPHKRKKIKVKSEDELEAQLEAMDRMANEQYERELWQSEFI